MEGKNVREEVLFALRKVLAVRGAKVYIVSLW